MCIKARDGTAFVKLLCYLFDLIGIDDQIAVAMSFLGHQNIYILEKALAWQKNGLLRSIASLFALHLLSENRALALIPVRKT